MGMKGRKGKGGKEMRELRCWRYLLRDITARPMNLHGFSSGFLARQSSDIMYGVAQCGFNAGRRMWWSM